MLGLGQCLGLRDHLVQLFVFQYITQRAQAITSYIDDRLLPRLRERMYSQLMWAQNMLMPWVWRHTLGSSRGKGLEPKRPVMAPLDASPALSEAE